MTMQQMAPANPGANLFLGFIAFAFCDFTVR
jgi:hypothetical protein